MANLHAWNHYVTTLELWVEELTVEVKELNARLNLQKGAKNSKKQLCAAYEWSQEEILFADTVMAFCKEFLFPWYKFLDDKLTENNSRENARSFSALVSRHLPVPRGIRFDDAWSRIIAPCIGKKYADMQCNLNNDCRKSFIGKLIGLFCSSIEESHSCGVPFNVMFQRIRTGLAGVRQRHSGLPPS
jgi:hypothetical protein